MQLTSRSQSADTMGGGPPQFTDLKELVRRLARDGPVKTYPTSKRIRIMFNQAFVADTTSALYVWEHEYYPQLYLPMEAFVNAPGFEVRLSHGDAITDDSGQIVGGEVELAVKRLNADEDFVTLTDMVLFAADLDGPAKILRNYVKVAFNAVDEWFEEDIPIHVHPKDPFKRVDTISSLRPIRILLNGTLLAESPISIHLYETSLPPRYYLPYTSVRAIYLQDSETVSECPYKGVANYHDIVIDGVEHKDLVWWYPLPTAECGAIAGMKCFFNEKVDVWMKDRSDGGGEWKLLERPKTHFV